MAQQSGIFPIFLRAEYREDGQGFARFQSDAARAAQAAKREFEGVRTALDAALSRPRNSGGSLDLGVDELRQAALAQQQIAAAAREVAEATKRAATANGQFDASMSRSTRAAIELANAEERVSREMLEQVAALEAVQRELNQTASATDLVTEANRRGTTANQNVINSQRASRTAFIQLGQQLQDVAVQAQMGTNAFLIFGQQAPQAAFALSGLAESANRTQRAIGNVATFLSGPWGAAIFVAVAALGPFVQKLFESGDEAEKAKRKTLDFASGLNILSMSADDASSAMDGLIGKLQSAIKFQGDFLRGQIQIARQNAADLQAQIKADEQALAAYERARKSEFGSSFLPTGLLPNSPNNPAKAYEMSLVRERLAQNRAKLPSALEAAGAAAIAEANRNIAESIDPIQKAINGVDDAIARLNQRRLDTVRRNDPLADNNLTQGEFERQLGDLVRRRAVLEKQQQDAKKKPPKAKVDREPERLARFADQAAEQVLRINDRFSDQPGLIRQSMQAMRQLDAIIAETNERMAKAKNLTKAQKEEFEGIISSARSAQQTVIEATSRPLELIRRESEQRLQIEEALAAGRTDEAAALQEIFRLEQQLGTEAELRAEMQKLLTQGRIEEARQIEGVLANYGLMRDEVRAITIEEERKLRVLRDQQAVFNAQLNVLNTVRRDLTDLLSGRSTDFFKNFTQSLQDLAGARLFESLFGQAFRDIEDELQRGTPQGRANAAYAAQVERTVQTTTRLEQALSVLTGAVTGAADRIRTGGAGLAANDNFRDPKMALVQSVLERAGVGGITVTAARPRPTEIARSSVMDIARRIAEGVVSPFRDTLESVLGRGLGGTIGDSIAGVIAGKATGGTTGAILGGLEGLTKGIKGLEGVSKTLGKMGGGAATGTLVAGIGQALGIKTSSTGGAIGGALGSLIPIPGGNIIGSILGSIIGGLFRRTPRASATIGGAGNGLGVTGVTGNKAELRTQVSGLGSNVLDVVNSIAQQLGASLDSSRGSVSIGVRDGKFRVDPTGRGQTETKKGAIDFGEDAQAAVRAAVMDLIQDGVIKGLRASEDRLLRAAKDVESGLRDVLTFRGVFDQLRAIKDPVGAAVDTLNREFTNLIDLFKRAGASTEEFAQLEELYNLKRAEAIKEATDRVVGSLRQLLDDLKTGDNGLSLRDRRNNTLTQFNALAARVAAGDKTAFDDFANVAKQLLDIERQLFGSTQSYFDRLEQVTKLTEKAIADQTALANAGAASPSPFDNSASIARSIDAASAEQVGWLRAINDNLIALNPGVRAVGSGGSGSGSPIPVAIENF